MSPRLATPIAVGVMVAGLLLFTGTQKALVNGQYTTVYTVKVNGVRLAAVSRQEDAGQAMDSLIARKTLSFGKKVSPLQRVTVEATRVKGAPQVSGPEDLESLLEAVLQWRVKGYVIRVDGHDRVTVADRGSAQLAIDSIMNGYREQIESRSGTSLKELKLLEKVEFVERDVDPSEIRSAEDAARLLARGTDRVATHVVKKGESIWSIARAAGLSQEELLRANPGIEDPSLIRPGDNISLVMPEPFVNVISRETVTYTERIPFSTETRSDPGLWPWQRVVKVYGSYGEKQLTVEITRKNGVAIQRRTLTEEVTRKPVTQVVVQGTRVIPPKGTGRFVWPLVGTVTSGFGPRGRDYHTGIDVAAPVGAPIRAADSGTVVFSGWMGGYGRTVIIDHGEGKLKTLYGHNSANLVQAGNTVAQGDIIARVGNTGRSTGPHLHFEIRVDDRPVNPLDYFPAE